MAIDKGVWTWTGFAGAPGYSVFYATPALGLSGVVKTFFESIKQFLPTTVNIASPSSGDTINELSGTLLGSWSGGVGGSTQGTGVGDYAAPAGLSVQWLTDGVVNGRRVRGRTFIVPILASTFDGQGNIDTAALNTVQSAADALVTAAAGELHVWHRPVNGGGGSIHAITGARVADRAAILRSRRD